MTFYEMLDENEITDQAERDDWFTARIDPYDDRIRELERFKYWIEKSYPEDAIISDLRAQCAGMQMTITELEVQLEASEAQAMRFARGLMEANAKVTAIHHVTAPGATMHKPPSVTTLGESNAAVDQTVPELQQAGTLQAVSDDRTHILS